MRVGPDNLEALHVDLRNDRISPQLKNPRDDDFSDREVEKLL